MAIFSELLIGSTLELGASFEVVRQPIHFYEFPVENLHAVETLGIDYDIAVNFAKILNDTYLATEEHASHVGKVLSDVSNGFTEQVNNNVGKSVVDTPVTSDIIDTIDVGKTLLDIPLTTDDNIYFGFERVVSESIMGMSDAPISHFYKYLDKTIDTAAPYLLGDYFAEDYITEADIILSAIDTASIQVAKGLTETVASGDSIPYMVITKVINESVTAIDTVNSIDPVYALFNDALDTAHSTELVNTNITKNISETQNANDSGSINIQDYWSYDYTSGAYEAGDYVGSNNSI